MLTSLASIVFSLDIFSCVSPTWPAVSNCQDTFQGLTNHYETLLNTMPLVTKAVTSGVTYLAGDLVAQSVRHGKEQQVDWQRAVKFATVGAGSGILCHHYYGALEDVMCAHAIASTDRMIACICVDQALWTPAWYAAYFIPLSALLEGKAVEEMLREVRERTLPLMLENAKVWLPACLLIYSVPVEWRTVVTNQVDFIWAVILSLLQASRSKDAGVEEMAEPLPRITTLAQQARGPVVGLGSVGEGRCTLALSRVRSPRGTKLRGLPS